MFVENHNHMGKEKRMTKLDRIQSLVKRVYGIGHTAYEWSGIVYVERDSDQHYITFHSKDFAIEILTEKANETSRAI